MYQNLHSKKSISSHCISPSLQCKKHDLFFPFFCARNPAHPLPSFSPRKNEKDITLLLHPPGISMLEAPGKAYKALKEGNDGAF